MSRNRIILIYKLNNYIGFSKMKTIIILTFVIFILVTSCQQNLDNNKSIEVNVFGKLNDNENANLYTLKNSKGSVMKVTDYGAIIVSLTMPDRNGEYKDIVLGYDNLEGYVKNNPYFGAIVGRYGNRIGKGKFKIDENEFQLAVNDGENHLHGGVVGFDKVLWKASPIEKENGSALKLTYNSHDGEEGYPGNLHLEVTYTLTNENELIIDYSGTTDKTTIVNPTQHSYFNLAGNGEPILEHELEIDADKFTPVDKGLITTGEILDVENTPMDFRIAKKIGKDINADYEQLKFGIGFDHNWVLNNYDGTLKHAASVYEQNSGRYMEVLTTEPGLQFYSGNFLDGTIIGKNNIVYNHRTGLCLEAQHFPDSPNKANFPSVLLKPGDEYKQTTVYKFSTK